MTAFAEFIIYSAVYVPFYLMLLYALVMGSRRRSKPSAGLVPRQTKHTS